MLYQTIYVMFVNIGNQFFNMDNVTMIKACKIQKPTVPIMYPAIKITFVNGDICKIQISNNAQKYDTAEDRRKIRDACVQESLEYVRKILICATDGAQIK